MKIFLQPWDTGFEHLADQLRQMFQEMQGHNYFKSHSTDVWQPRINLYETQARLLVCVELAGVDPQRVDVRLDAGELRIAGVRKKPTWPQEYNIDATASAVSVHQMEIDSGRFERRVPLTGDVDVASVSATYKDGFLWVNLPRRGSSHHGKVKHG